MLEIIVDFVLHFWPLQPRKVFALFACLVAAVWLGFYLAGIDPSGPAPKTLWD